jgi:2-haloacid dehalogenase
VARFADFFEDRGIELDPRSFSPLYLAMLGEGAFLFPGVRELLEEVSASHILAIITNGITEVQKRRIAKAGIGGYFRAVIISDEIGFSKPDQAYFSHAMRALGISDPAEALIVGDSLSSDILGGIRSGIDTCWFNPGHHQASEGIVPTYEIDSFDLLRPILRTHDKRKIQGGTRS